MENPIEEFEDALSLCDLSDLCDHEIDPSNEILGSPSTHEDFFEFSTSETHSTMVDDNIIFCGKVISCKTELNDLRNPPFPSSTSPSSSSLLPKKNKLSTSNSSSKNSSKSGTFRIPSVNSRKQKVMIGLAKIPAKMELSDLRERQNRRPPSTMSPGLGSVVADSGKSSWGLIRLFRVRSPGISSMLPKNSFGCISLARPCID
ncbi:hypothetical protein MANES_10G044100v8 [Manihot esculenta]|uniref:Uncharacterized protein n=1 Tax=Manihot esculenta TaxID=3983 RepID=A0A2C9V3A7_MANES|nr:hypothetical protein MANES_10G044100v8 [Manihot esculenta]